MKKIITFYLITYSPLFATTCRHLSGCPRALRRGTMVKKLFSLNPFSRSDHSFGAESHPSNALLIIVRYLFERF